MMRLKNAKELARMRASGRLVAECFAILEENVKPGVTLKQLDRLVEEMREEGKKIVPRCSYVVAMFDRKREKYADIKAEF